MVERGRNKKWENFRDTTKKKKWINESYAQPNEDNHLKINTKDLSRTPTFLVFPKKEKKKKKKDSYISTINTYITNLNVQPLP